MRRLLTRRRGVTGGTGWLTLIGWPFALALLLIDGRALAPSIRLGPSVARAEPDAIPLHIRSTFSGASMVSKDQREWLGYDKWGWQGDLQIGYRLSSLIDLRATLGGGAFISEHDSGGLVHPLLGAALGWPDVTPRPWLQLDAGVGFTGELVRPVIRASVGLDFDLSRHFTLGPVLGYSQVFQHDSPSASTDARFVWGGFALGIHPTPRPVVKSERQVVRVKKQVTVKKQVVERVRTPPATELPEIPIEPKPVVTEPSPELAALLDDAIPSSRNEWLAPVLFASDRADLEPQGVAMLHEVARELARRPQLKRIEIHGYADLRGPAEHNRELSRQRAEAVFDWLVAHGVEPERLVIAANGATEPVESGESDTDHQQNRRVVFRIIETEETQ